MRHRCYIVTMGKGFLFLIIPFLVNAQCFDLGGRVLHSGPKRLIINSHGREYSLVFAEGTQGIRYAQGTHVKLRAYYDKKVDQFLTKDDLIDLPLRSTASNISSLKAVSAHKSIDTCLKVRKQK